MKNQMKSVKVVHGNIAELHGRFKQNTVRDRVLEIPDGHTAARLSLAGTSSPPGFVFCLFSTFWATIAQRIQPA